MANQRGLLMDVPVRRMVHNYSMSEMNGTTPEESAYINIHRSNYDNYGNNSFTISEDLSLTKES